MAPKFIFVRHGEAEHNVAFHQSGQSVFTDEKYRDPPLTQQGVQDSIKTGKELSNLNIAAIWSSPSTRCIQTAEEIFEEIDVDDLYLHDNLLERQGGRQVCNERLPKSQLKQWHSFWNMKLLPEIPAKWDEYEDNYSLRQRMLMLVMLLSDMYKDDSYVIIVSHKQAINALTGNLLESGEYVIPSLDDI